MADRRPPLSYVPLDRRTGRERSSVPAVGPVGRMLARWQARRGADQPRLTETAESLIAHEARTLVAPALPAS